MNFNMGLDIGSSMVRMTARGRGVIFSESSALALRREDQSFFAIGSSAHNLRGRVPDRIRVEIPMSAGHVTRDEYLMRWLVYLFETAQSVGIVNRPSVLIAIDPMTQPSAARHMVALALDAGASASSTVRSDMMAALGAGRMIMKPETCVLLDVGDKSVVCTLACAGRVFRSESLPYGMSTINDGIIRTLREKHGLIIGEGAAEEIKLDLCSAKSGREEVKLNVTGYSPKTGFPASIVLGGEEVAGVATMLVTTIRELVASVVDSAPVELSAELTDKGIIMTGGGANLFGLDAYIAETVGLPCRMAEDPVNATIRGLTEVVERPDAYQPLIDTPTRRIERRLGVGRGQ